MKHCSIISWTISFKSWDGKLTVQIVQKNIPISLNTRIQFLTGLWLRQMSEVKTVDLSYRQWGSKRQKCSMHLPTLGLHVEVDAVPVPFPKGLTNLHYSTVNIRGTVTTRLWKLIEPFHNQNDVLDILLLWCALWSLWKQTALIIP